jgi:hypothetical protein
VWRRWARRFLAVGFFVELFASSTRRTDQGIQLE